VRVIDPAPAIARQARRLLALSERLNPRDGGGRMRFFTSGDPGELMRLLPPLSGEIGPVQQAYWTEDPDPRLQA